MTDTSKRWMRPWTNGNTLRPVPLTAPQVALLITQRKDFRSMMAFSGKFTRTTRPAPTEVAETVSILTLY